MTVLDRDEEPKLLAFLASLAGLRNSRLGEQLPDRLRLLNHSQSVLH